MGIAYLAVPYQHSDKHIMEYRFHVVNRVAARLMSQGWLIFSPISHTHPIAESGDLPKGWDYWGAYDRAMLHCCSDLIVLQLGGWETSVGVQSEIAIAINMGIPIHYINEDLT